MLENVRRLEVSVQDVPIVEGFQARCHLNESVPNFSLGKLRGVLLVRHDLAVEVTAVGVLHHDAEGGRRLIKKGVFVGNHIFVAADANVINNSTGEEVAYLSDARMRTSFRAFYFSFSVNRWIFTCTATRL